MKNALLHTRSKFFAIASLVLLGTLLAAARPAGAQPKRDYELPPRDEMSRDRTLAQLRTELLSHVAVELVVEGFHLLPETLEIGFERGGGHVVAGAPKRTHVGEADFFCPLVSERNVALVLRLHRRRDRMPSNPRFRELVVVAALLQDAREVVELEALLRRSLAPLLGREILGELRAVLRAVFPFPVHPPKLRLHLRKLGALRCIRGRRHGLPQAEERHLALPLGRKRHALEALCGDDRLRHVLGRRFLARGRNEFRVVGDEVRAHPARSIARDPKATQIRVDVLEKRDRLVRGGRRRGRRRRTRRGCGRDGDLRRTDGLRIVAARCRAGDEQREDCEREKEGRAFHVEREFYQLSRAPCAFQSVQVTCDIPLGFWEHPGRLIRNTLRTSGA